MGQEVDLLIHYPKPKRDVDARSARKKPEDRHVARQFGRDFFDGDRRHGYGGFSYHERFWTPVVPTLEKHFGLASHSSLLDVGCAKGFMLHDLARLIPGISLAGIDISEYAIDHAIADMRPYVKIANATKLPFADDSFDVVISINTVHNLSRKECATALAEIERVHRRGAFVTVDAYRTKQEKARMLAWNLTAQTILHVEEWRALFDEVGYSGDYYWFIP